MNTFVPYGAAHKLNAACLDTKRLVKQLVECQQIYDALRTGLSAHILHHPATQMWAGHEDALLVYAWHVYQEYKQRFPGRLHKSGEYLWSMLPSHVGDSPDWLNQLAPHHRTKLYCKDPAYYCQFKGFAGVDLGHYPITKDGRTVGWVHRPVSKWLSSDGRYYTTAWAAICAARSTP